jgi:hypothetical protein
LTVQVGSEAVPQGLILSTVDAALAIDAFKTITAGAAAASVLALTQGVLTTMKLAQLKWTGLMILATSLAAGGVIAVGYAAGLSPKQARNVAEVAVNVDDPQGQSGPKSSDVTSPSQDAPPNATDPFRPNSDVAKSDAYPNRVVDLSNRSIRELEGELRLALNNVKITEVLSKNNSIGTAERLQARGKVELVKATLEGLAEDLSDEIDRLKLETIKKNAELERAGAQKALKAVPIARNKRLNERKAGMVSEDEVTAAEAEHNVSVAQISIVHAEKAEVELRIQQLLKRVGRIKEIIKLAEPTREIKP